MQVHSAFPAGVLLTNGLGADGMSGAIITAAKWSLFGCEGTIAIIPTSSGGGSHVFAPGEIQNFYQPVNISDGQYTEYIPTKLETKSKNIVVVKFKFKDIENEKEFILKEKPFRMAVKLINIVNMTDNLIKVSFKSIKHKISNIKISIKNILVKQDKI